MPNSVALGIVEVEMQFAMADIPQLLTTPVSQ
jgi:hypothetical protein